MDGASLKQALHQQGINLRYLGHVIKAINQSEHKERLRHIMVSFVSTKWPTLNQTWWCHHSSNCALYCPSFCVQQRLAIGEIFIRSTRRVFNSFLQVLCNIMSWACQCLSTSKVGGDEIAAGVGPTRSTKEWTAASGSCLCRAWMCLVSLQLSVTSSAAYWFPTSRPLLWGRRRKRSQGGVAEGPGPPKARPGARSRGLSCGTWSARMLLRHTTSLTASGEDIRFVCSYLMFTGYAMAQCQF